MGRWPTAQELQIPEPSFNEPEEALPAPLPSQATSKSEHKKATLYQYFGTRPSADADEHLTFAAPLVEWLVLHGVPHAALCEPTFRVILEGKFVRFKKYGKTNCFAQTAQNRTGVLYLPLPTFVPTGREAS